MSLKSYKDLKVWQKSRIFVKKIYHATQLFPKEEQYGLTNQLRRASVSVASNIAEGYARRTTLDYLRMINIAFASVAEIETQLILANDLEFLNAEKFTELYKDAEEIGRMLNGLSHALRKKNTKSYILNPSGFEEEESAHEFNAA